MKLCECGCGLPAPIADRNRREMGWVKGEPKRFISGHNCKGENNPRWKGGTISFGNYRLQYAPGHPRTCNGNHVLEHILKAEKALGKPLPPKAVVHHHTQTQLVICQDQSYHMVLHARERAIKKRG